MSPLLSVEFREDTHSPEATLPSYYKRPARVVAIYPFGRSYLYERLANGDFKSFCLKKKGARHGLRLIDCRSVDAYLERKAAEASEAASPKKAGTEKTPVQPETNSEAEVDSFSEFERGGNA
jgi:hypothetical protein